MDELIQLVTEKAGISEAQAKTAVETVMKYMKDKLPPALADQVEAAMSGEGMASGAGDLLSSATSLFGKK
jgi:uncharacterized protein (DUF2267 family)